MIQNRLLFLTFLAFLVFIPVAWAGGIIQEMYVDPNQPLTAQNVEDPEIASNSSSQPPHHQKTTSVPMVSVRVSEDGSRVLISWQQHSFDGRQATRYSIYRRIRGTKKWTLLATVDGKTLKFLDLNVSVGVSYEYKVIALYEEKGKMTISWDYPLTNAQVLPTQPAQGIGCQTVPPSTAFSWLALLLFLPFLLKRRR